MGEEAAVEAQAAVKIAAKADAITMGRGRMAHNPTVLPRTMPGQTLGEAVAGRLQGGDGESLGRLLDSEPIVNCYLRSELRLGPSLGHWWGVSGDDGLSAALLSGGIAVPWIPHLADAAALVAALRQEGALPRMLVGPRDPVLALHEALGLPAREIRDPQPLVTLHRDDVLRTDTGDVPLRLATRADLEGITVAAAAMHHEEMGIDPLTIDADGWRARMTNLIDRGWSWVWIEGGEVIFKAELSAWMPDVVQLQGVYTAPAHRGRGRAEAGLAAVCAMVFSDVPVCSLYVNGYNAAARRLYDKLGFRHHCEFATVIY